MLQYKNTVEKKIHDVFQNEKKTLALHHLQQHCVDVSETFVLGDGKRLRPLSLLAFFAGSNGTITEKIIEYASAMELLHCSTLIADDVIDEDELRRNAKTVVKRYLDEYNEQNETNPSTSKFLFLNKGANYAASIAVLAANIVYVIATKLCLDDPKTLNRVVQLYIRINYGQILDMSVLPTEEEYFEMAELKTAIFFETTAAIGLSLANRSEDDIRIGETWGHHYGIGFQMRDDLLDIDAKGGKLRKIGSDLKEGKKTSIVWEALRDGVLSEEDRNYVKQCLKLNEKILDDQVMAEKLLGLLRGKPTENVRKKIQKHHQLSIEALEKLHLQGEYYEYLLSITNLLLN